MAAIVGPLPDNHAAHAPASSAASSAAADSGTCSSRSCWCRRSSVAARSAATSPLAQAATNIAARPTLNTASARDTVSGSRPRECSVEVVVEFGTHTTTIGLNASGTCTTPRSVATTTPP